MKKPELLNFETREEYRTYYKNNYCRAEIMTFDGVRVYFEDKKFSHAFFENAESKSGPKNKFSKQRAERMPWIEEALKHPNTELYMGWNKHTKLHDEDRRVTVVFENFVVVIELALNRSGDLKANFVTCYVADRSIQKIRKSPKWDKTKCIEKLKNKKSR